MRSGIDPAAVDPDVRPQDDLFAHVNGRWIATTEIPADKGRYGTFDVLRENAESHVRDIIAEVAAGSGDPGSVAAKVGDLFASFMDEDAVESLGGTPLDEDLAVAAAVSSPDDVVAATGAFTRDGILSFVIPFVKTDDRDPSRYVVYLEQAGLGLPDECYYREDQYDETRTAYLAHVERMLALAGWADPPAAAQRIMTLETRIAAGHWDSVTNRDPVKTYTLVDRDSLSALSPGLDWDAFLGGLGAPAGAFDAVVVRQPDHVRSVASALVEEPLQAWRDWLAWHVVHGLAPYLSSVFVDENFDFYGRTLSGVPELRERWKRGVSLVEEALGEAVGQLYVERHFPPHAKERMVHLVDNLVEAFRRSLSAVPWMGERDPRRGPGQARSVHAEDRLPRALARLRRPRGPPGRPPRQRPPRGRLRGRPAARQARGPVDRDEWFMTPQTVNAYYNPGLNEIVFPAAILQPPFFDVDADSAVNYGGIGAVIGHEIGHGFDDQGSQFDGSGTLRDWWTDEDRAAFQALADALIAQFGGLEGRDAPGRKVNGALTVGENIGDLGGLTIGHAAYLISLDGDEAPEIDGRTGEQRFFMGWAQIWRGVSRRAEAERLLALDPHSPMDLRANAARNLTEFHEAFGVVEGDGMWLPPESRVRIF